jgi:hypothetical protein
MVRRKAPPKQLPNSKPKGAKNKNKPSTKKDVQRSLPIEQLPKENLKYTFFAACGNYPKKGFDQYEHVWWSRNRLQQQLWKEIDNDPNNYHPLGPKFNGHVPQKVLEEILAEELFGGKDFRKIYKNWAFVYQIGTSKYVNGRYEEVPVTRKDSKGNEYQTTQRVYKYDLLSTPIKTVEDSRGSPPTTSYTKEERAEYRRRKYGEE